MSHARGRRALRTTVLAASIAVLASFVVAPTARAESTAAPTEAAPGIKAAPSTDAAPSTSEPTSTAPPTEAAPGTTEAPPAPATSDAPVTPVAGEVTPGDTVVGELVQAWPDPTAEDAHHEDADHAGEAPLSWIETPDGDAVRVPTEDIPTVAVGSTIAVTVGEELTDEASREQGFEPALEVLDATVLAAAEPDPTTAETGTVPTNTVTAVLVVPAGGSADGTTITSVVNQLNGSVSAFWNSQSDGTVRITAVAGAPGWLSSAQSCANPSALWNDVAGQIGWTAGAGKHLMLYLPASSTSCSYGLGTVGSSIGTGGRSYVRDVALSVMAHELGHNFGLGHSSEYQCNSALETGTCQTRDYYDFYDIMGISWGQVGSLNAAQAARLGLLPSSEQVELTPSSPATTVSLAPASATSGVRAVKLTDGNGVVYYLEYRQASGQDAWLGDGRNAYGLNSGVVLRRAGSGANTSLLLDGTPSPSSGWSSDLQQALPMGTPVSFGSGGLSVTVQAVTTGSATIRVGSGQSPISAAYAAAGGAGGWLGHALAVESCGLPTAGCWRPFERGLIFWSANSGAHIVAGDIGGAWLVAGGPSSAAGYPTADVQCGLASGGCVQQFQAGRYYWSPASGAAVVLGSILTGYEARGAQDGSLGYPLAAEFCGLNSGGCAQPFATGWLFWSARSAAQLVAGDIGGAWLAAGGPSSVSGYPIADVQCGLASGGCVQQYQTGRYYWAPSSGAAPVLGSVLTGYEARDAQDGPLGYPVAGEICGLAAGGCAQPFQHAWLFWSTRSAAQVVTGDIGGSWLAAGGPWSPAGYPIADVQCGLASGGCVQQYQSGRYYWSAATGAAPVLGAILRGFEARNAQDGALGYPTGPAEMAPGGWLQRFRGGVLFWNAVSGQVTNR